MFDGLQVGLSGLRANQRFLDVIGNNLANASTVGFKSDRATFQDTFYRNLRAASGPSNNLGGINAQQIGLGAGVASIDKVFSGGNLQLTGRSFDLAIEGQGFFILNDGMGDVYSRVGTFTLDADSNLVDSRTGYKVQNVNRESIQLGTTSSVPAQATSEVTFAGNLPAIVTGPLAEIHESAAAFEEHLAAMLSASIGASTVDLATNNALTLAIDDAPQVNLTFTAADFAIPGVSDPTGGALTLADLVLVINQKLVTENVNPSMTASDDGSGNLVLTSNRTGNISFLQASGTAATAIGLPAAAAGGSEAIATSTTDINDLSANTLDYLTDGSGEIRVTGTNGAGNAVNLSFVYGVDGTTLGDLVNFINASGAYPNANAVMIDSGPDAGRIRLTSTVTGENAMSLIIQDGSTSSGSTIWGAHSLQVDVEGSGPDTRNTAIVIYDSLGIPHTINGMFERQEDGSWILNVSVDDNDTTVTGSPIVDINFGPDGSFQGPADVNISLSYSNGANLQTVALEFGEVGGFDGLSLTGGDATAQAISQDGFEAGSLVSFGVNQGGVIQGFYSNGSVVDLETIAIALFANQGGLTRVGNTAFRNTDNSGTALISEAGNGGAGAITSGALEGSNVDVAREFVGLIQAQRSFQGSARVVSTMDEILAELINIL